SASGHMGLNEAYRWEGGVTAPVPMPAGSQSLPTDVSADGRIIVGYYSMGISDVRAFRYENGLFEDLGLIPSALGLESRLRISTNNQAVTGWGQPNGPKEAVLWRG